MYTCGPTVYWSTHIGHMSKYVGDDVLRRTLTYFGYDVKHVMNITDVGHLTSDADEGEDKMEKGALREGVTVWDIAKKYEAEFFDTMRPLNVLYPDVVARATEHIGDQIDLIKRLEAKGFVYETKSAVYFDVQKFPTYGELSGQKLDDKKVGARDDVIVDPDKKNPYDFVLWFKNVGRFEHHIMHWDSPWGVGFPGWHIECSAMSMKYLGEQLDIHTGGIDHIGVHHPAETAQSEAATGKQFVKYWVHRVFIMVDGKKMSKSLGNFYTLADVLNKGIDPLALRYLFLSGHYRAAQNFTWESLQAAQVALMNLRDVVWRSKQETERMVLSAEKQTHIDHLRDQFDTALADDLNTPAALAVVWEVAKSNLPGIDKADLLIHFDQVLGLGLADWQPETVEIPEAVTQLVADREQARKDRDFAKADALRQQISQAGFEVQDSAAGQVLKRVR